MEYDESLLRLQSLQRDLIAFSELRLPNLERLSAELDGSVGDLKKLLDKKKKNEASRKELIPTTTPRPSTVKIQDVEYAINDDFRQAALVVADELDLDELEAAKLCIDAAPLDINQTDTSLPFRALLRFHDNRYTLLDCLRLLLGLSLDNDRDDGNAKQIIKAGLDGIFDSIKTPDNSSAYFRKCTDALSEIEAALQKVGDHRQTIIMTGQSLQSDMAEALEGQRILLTRQHESLCAAMSFIIQGLRLQVEDFRPLLTKAATVEAPVDITIHYLPILISASAFFGSSDSVPSSASHDLHRLFAVGSGRLQWRQPELRAAVTACWLAEYNHRFEEPTSDPVLRVADRQQAEHDRADLFMECIKDKGFHFMLTACRYLKPEVWHDPAKIGLVDFLLLDAKNVPIEAPSASDFFSDLTMEALQSFTDAFISNMPDVVRRLKIEEDDQRRIQYSRMSNEPSRYEPHLERFMVIMSYAYQEDSVATEAFLEAKDSNLHGFLRWVSKRLPTPRVAAFCELLRSIATRPKNANLVHKFLLGDTEVISGRSRKRYNVGWSQIFAELDTYATSLRNRPAIPMAQDGQNAVGDLIEAETGIMLEAYMRLAAYICRASADARNWLLREQSFHLADVMFQLAASGVDSRVQASCFTMLAAMLTDKVTEVNDGMWAMLDNWIHAGGAAGANVARTPVTGKVIAAGRHYLQQFNQTPEIAAAFVNLLTDLIRLSPSQDIAASDSLPFPESLGAQTRHAGIDDYVDFVIGTAFKGSSELLKSGYDADMIHVLRSACLEFMCVGLASFNEDLVLLANTTNVAVDSAIKVSSLATYAHLHPFARIMEWLFNGSVIGVLFDTVQQNVDDLNGLSFHCPLVQTVFRSVEVMDLAMRLQTTYFDIVRPIVKIQTATRSPSVGNAAWASFDEVMLSRLGVVVDIVGFAASKHTDLSLASLSLLQKLCVSRKMGDTVTSGGERIHVGNRLVEALAMSSDAISMELQLDFSVFEYDIEDGEVPAKLIKAKAVLDMLNSNLASSPSRPTLAHSLLGFTCRERTIETSTESAFGAGRSLFHAVAACAAQVPVGIRPSNFSWLLALKRGCLDVLLRLVVSPLTASVVLGELRTMDFLAAAWDNQVLAGVNPLWDGKECLDPESLLSSSADAIRDFHRVRELYFEYAASELRSAVDTRAYSVQEKAISAFCGTLIFPTGEREATLSVLDLFDFYDLETTNALEVTPRFLANVDLSACAKDDAETVVAFDLKLVEELLVLRKRELLLGGTIKVASEEQQVDDEIRAILASIKSQNSWRSIQAAQLEALEAWTDLIAMIVTSGGLESEELVGLALQSLQAVLPKFERSLLDRMESAALLAKLTLTLIPAAMPAGEQRQQNASNAFEKLLSAFRICLKAVTDGGTDLALRDVCYRICCNVSSALPPGVLRGTSTPSPQLQQMSQLVQVAGGRLLSVATEDAFSGRGSTRVSAALFLDALVTLSQSTRTTPTLLNALAKLNFVPVLIDISIGGIASSFQVQNEDLQTTLAFFHTAMSLLLRICQTTDGTQLVLNSGFFSTVSDSRLFSTDPDIGLDIDNPAALKQFYRLLSAVLRVITAIVVSKGPDNAATLQQGRSFLQLNRFGMQAVFKRISAVQKTSGPPETEAMEVADEFGRLMLVTGFLEEDESAHHRAARVNGFS